MIPFNNLRAVNSVPEIQVAVARVDRSYHYILGPEGTQFESRWARFCGSRYCVGVASGTDGLILALMVAGVRPGDLVLTVANTAPPTIMAIYSVGAIPVFIGINSDGLISIESVKKSWSAITILGRVGAIVPVHLYGRVCDMAALTDFAAGVRAPVIEDCAHAHGSILNGRSAGSLGDMGVYSFYPTKPLGAQGDAGCIVTDNKEYSERLTRMRNYGSGSSDELPTGLGRNSRLDEVQAAILGAKLRYLDDWNAERRKICQTYIKRLKTMESITVPQDQVDNSSCHLFPILVDNRDQVMLYLHDNGIDSRVRYRMFHPGFGRFINMDTEKTTDNFCSRLLCLPLWNGMSDEEVNLVSDKLGDLC